MEEFEDSLESDNCHIVLQVKDDEWNDWVNGQSEEIAEKSGLQFFTEKR